MATKNKTPKKAKPSKALKKIATLMPITKLHAGGVVETTAGRFSKLFQLDMAQDITSVLKHNNTRCSVQLFAMSQPKSEEAISKMAKDYNIPNMPETLYETMYYVVFSMKAPKVEALKELNAAEEAFKDILLPLSGMAVVNLLHTVYHPGKTEPVLASEPECPKKTGYIDFIESIAPETFTNSLKKVEVNGVPANTILLIDYSSQLNPDFYMDITSTNRPLYMSSHYEPIDTDGVIGWLKDKLKADDALAPSNVKNPKSKAAQKQAAKPSSKSLSPTKRNDYELMLQKLTEAKDAGERVYSVSTYITVFGTHEDELDENIRLIRDKSKRYYMNFIDAQSQHKQAFNASLPLGFNKCEVSSTMFAEDYSKLVPNGEIADIFSHGVFYATDSENEAPFIMDRSKLNTKRGFIFGSDTSNKQALMVREMEALRKTDTAVIVLDIDNNIDVEGEKRDVTQVPVFPVGESYSLKCTLLGNVIRALINKKAGLLKDESEALNKVFAELESIPDYSFSSFMGRVVIDEVLNKKIVALLQDIPMNCKDSFTTGDGSKFIVYKFDKVESHNPLFSNRDIYGLFALACAYEQALYNQSKGIKTHIYVNGFDAGIFHVKNAKYLATILNQEKTDITFTLASEQAGMIVDGIKRNVKTDTIEMNNLVRTIVESEFIAIYNISPSYRQTIWTLLELHPQYMQCIVPEQDAGIIRTPYKTVPFTF